MVKTYKTCQSCGMPFNKDPKGGGSEANGGMSLMYCSYCYENGKFKQPDWTAKQMQEYSKAKMKEMGFPGFFAWLFTLGIPGLERWKKK